MRICLLLTFFLLATISLIIQFNVTECGRSGSSSRGSSSSRSSSSGGRKSSSSSSGSRWKSSSSGGSSSSGSKSRSSTSSNGKNSLKIWKSKNSGRVKSSSGNSQTSHHSSNYPSAFGYPKQQWNKKVSIGIGGGGFVLPKTSNGLSNSAKPKYVGGVSPGVGGGGWISPTTKSNFNHLTFDNTFGRYGGGKEPSGKSRGKNLFGESGRRSFGIGTGAGFAGDARSGLASMESFHRYKQYKALMEYKRYGHYGGYSGRGIYYRQRYQNCYGGCYGGSFCDFGICRCYQGSFPSHGSCWNNWNEYIEEKNELRRSTNFNPFLLCTNNITCQEIDMNLICSTESGASASECQCRADMKWNEDKLQCEIYMDVDCSIFEFGNNFNITNLLSNSSNEYLESTTDMVSSSGGREMSQNLNPKWDDCTDDMKGAVERGLKEGCKLPGYLHQFYNTSNMYGTSNWAKCALKCEFCLEKYMYNKKTSEKYKKFCPKTCNLCEEKWKDEYGGLDVDGIDLPSYNLTEGVNGTFSLNLTDLSPNETLSTSYLVRLDLNKTEPMEIKKEFCIEIKAISLKYSEPERIARMIKESKVVVTDGASGFSGGHIMGLCILIFILSVLFGSVLLYRRSV